MKKELPAPLMAVIVVLFVAVIAAFGWYMINKNGVKPLTPEELQKQASGAKVPPGGVGNSNAGAGSPVKDQN